MKYNKIGVWFDLQGCIVLIFWQKLEIPAFFTIGRGGALCAKL